MRYLCYAGALRHVRRRIVVCPHPPHLLRRGRPQRRRGGQRRAVFRLALLPSQARGLWRYRRDRSGSAVARFLRGAAVVGAPWPGLSASETRGLRRIERAVPGFAALNPGYGSCVSVDHIPSSASSFAFKSVFVASATRRMALAWKKSSVRNVPTLGCTRRSGASRLSFSLMMALVMTSTVA